jgi:hypothetical protein
MQRMVRVLALLLIFAGMTAYVPSMRLYAQNLGQSVLDQFDSRPALAVLLVGNSRTYYNNMPGMIRAIADSASSPQKYQITMRAVPAGNLQNSWDDPKVQTLLSERWDKVLFQASSAGHADNKQRDAFLISGKKLISAAKANSPSAAMIVNWIYGSTPERQIPESMRRQYFDMVQFDHKSLARQTGADLVNVGYTWENVMSKKPGFSLYTDGNHPSIQGSYLSALMIYAYLSNGALDKVSYVPAGMTREDSLFLISAVKDYCTFSPTC